MRSSDNKVLEELDQLLRRVHELTEKGYDRSAVQLAEEARRRAREEHFVIPYLYANFLIMNSSQSLYDYRRGTDIAIETITLLESEERAREIQPDLPLDEYEKTIYWLTSCAYDNLAEHYAIRYGYGGERVQGVAQDGFDVCHRTGKLECLACFRQYAMNVYEAAGDLEMAMHFARGVFQSLPMVETNDRRAVGGMQYASQLTLMGRLKEALEVAEASVGLAKVSYDPLKCRFLAQCCLGEILYLLGRGDEFEERCAVLGEPVDWTRLPPATENPELARRKALFDSVRLTYEGALHQAEELLSFWDRDLYDRQALGPWFEVRLRRIALHRLMGYQDSVQKLGDTLRKEARQNQSWLYAERLAVMERGDVPLSPIPFLCAPQDTTFVAPGSDRVRDEAAQQEMATASGQESVSEKRSEQTQETAGSSETARGGFDWSSTPLAPKFDEWANRYAQDQSETQVAAIFEEMVGIAPDTVQVPEDAARLLFVTGQMAELLGRELELWTWAKQFLNIFPENGDVLNLVATAGLSAVQARSRRAAEMRALRGKRKKAAGRKKRNKRRGTLPTLQQLEEMFHKSLELSPRYPRHFLRAAQFYRFAGHHGEAEWCLARSFALDRSNPVAALALADMYSENDRDEDALAVLDLCLREGQVEDSEVAWNAGLTAFRLGRFPDAETYFNHAAQWGCQEVWLFYYRAWTLLELKKVDEATEDILAFEAARGGSSLGSHTLWAWVAAHKGKIEDLKKHVQEAMAIPLQQVNDLSDLGIEKNYHQMYRIARNALPADDVVLASLVDRLFQAGLVPDELLEEERRKRPLLTNLRYYVCVLHQPLDDDWATHPACWENQKDWDAYTAYWGVLAHNAEEAEHYAIQAQSRCYHLPPDVVEVELADEGFVDRPGVVFQGTRRYEDNSILSQLRDYLDDSSDDSGGTGDFDDLDKD